jgi:hypothetical protein
MTDLLRCLLVSLSIVVLAQAKSFPIHIQPLDQQLEIIQKGIIDYDADTNSGSFQQLNEFTGRACIGIVTDGMFNCVTLADIKGRAKYIVHLNSKQELVNLDYVPSVGDDEVVNDEVVIAGIQRGPLPDLKEPLKLVDNKIPEPPVEKSLLQKYWIYLVPLVLMLVVSGGSEQQQQQE